MNFGNIKAAIYQWVAAVHGAPVTVVWDEPEAPRPHDPSVRLSFISPPSRIGIDELRPGDLEDQFRIVGPREMLLAVTAYGDDSDALIMALETSVSDPSKMAILYAEGVTILENTKARDVTVAVETKFEKRTQMDFTLLTMEDLPIEVGEITEVEITSDIGGRDDSISASSGGE